MRILKRGLGWVLGSGAAIAVLALPALAVPVRVTDLDFEVLEDAEAVHVRSDGKLELEVRELDGDTLSIEVRGAVLDDRATARIVPRGESVVRVVSATPAMDARGPLLRIRIEHVPGHRPAIEPGGTGFSAVFARPAPGSLPPPTVPAFRSIPVSHLIREVAARNGETLLVGEQVAQRISLVGPRRLSSGELSALLDTALLMKSRVAVPMPGGGRKIMNASGAPFPWVPELQEGAGDTPLLTLVRLDHVDGESLLSILQPLLGRLTLGVAHEPSNSILLAGSSARVARLRDIMLALDEAPSEDVLRITLRERGSDEVLEIIERVFDQDEIITALSDARTNTLLLRVRSSMVERVRGIIARLDRKLDWGGQLHVFQVHFADPLSLAEQLKSLQSDSSSRVGTGRASLAGRSFSIEVHEPTSSLLLNASATTARIIADLLAEIDVTPPRVRVDVRLVEVVTESNLSVGFDAFLPFGKLLDAGSAGGFVMSAPSPGGAGALFSGEGDFVARMARSPLVVPLVNATGNVVDVTIPQQVFQVSAGESETFARVLQNPSLLVASGEEQMIFVGDNVPVPVAGSDVGDPLRVTSNIERHDTGTTLRVTPTVGVEGRVELELYVESSRVGASAAGDVERVGPSFVERVVETTVQLPSGVLAVIGFAARPFTEDVVQGVPFLRSIPVLGTLFRYQSVVELKSTLLVTVGAQVESVDQQELARALKRELALPVSPPVEPPVSGGASSLPPADAPRPQPHS